MKGKMKLILTGVFLIVMMITLFGCSNEEGTFDGKLISAERDTLVLKGDTGIEAFTTTNKTEYDLAGQKEITKGDSLQIEYHKKGDQKLADRVTITEAVDHSLTMEGELSDLNERDFVLSSDSLTVKFTYDTKTKIKGKLNEGDEIKVTYHGSISEEPYAESIEVLKEQEDDPHYEAHGIIADVSDTTVLLSIDSAEAHRFIINDDTEVVSPDNKVEIGDRAEITFTGDIDHDPVATKLIVHHEAKEDQNVVNGTIDKAEKTYMTLDTGKHEYKILIDDSTKFKGAKYASGDKATVTYKGNLKEEPLAIKVYCSKGKNEDPTTTAPTATTAPTTKPTQTTEPTTEKPTETDPPTPPQPVTITVIGFIQKWDGENMKCTIKVEDESIIELTTQNADIPIGYFPQEADHVQVVYDRDKMDMISMVLIDRPDPDPQTPPDRDESKSNNKKETETDAPDETVTEAPTTTTKAPETTTAAAPEDNDSNDDE